MLHKMETAEKTKTGLFIANFEIGENMPGALHLALNLSVFTPEETLSGIGHITQAVNPPVNIATKISGGYTYMCVMPKNCHILVTATGYPIIKWPQGAGIGPVEQPNFELRMVLEENWKSGVANYKFMDGTGKWHEVNNAPVKFATADTIVG